MKKTYIGGCHCGKVTYEVDMELESVMECNCSHCAKKGFLLAFVPALQFRLIGSEDGLSEYRFNKRSIAHIFCDVCGVQSYGRGQKQDGTPTVMINVRCLNEVDPTTLTINSVNGKDF